MKKNNKKEVAFSEKDLVMARERFLDAEYWSVEDSEIKTILDELEIAEGVKIYIYHLVWYRLGFECKYKNKTVLLSLRLDEIHPKLASIVIREDEFKENIIKILNQKVTYFKFRLGEYSVKKDTYIKYLLDKYSFSMQGSRKFGKNTTFPYLNPLYSNVTLDKEKMVRYINCVCKEVYLGINKCIKLKKDLTMSLEKNSEILINLGLNKNTILKYSKCVDMIIKSYDEELECYRLSYYFLCKVREDYSKNIKDRELYYLAQLIQKKDGSNDAFDLFNEILQINLILDDFNNVAAFAEENDMFGLSKFINGCELSSHAEIKKIANKIDLINF